MDGRRMFPEKEYENQIHSRLTPSNTKQGATHTGNPSKHDEGTEQVHCRIHPKPQLLQRSGGVVLTMYTYRDASLNRRHQTLLNS